MVNRKRFAAAVEIRDQSARFKRKPSLAVKVEGLLDHVIGRRECAVRVASLDIVLVGEVIVERPMNRTRSERGLSIEQSRQFLPFDIEKLDGVFGLGAGLRNHGGDRLPLKVSDVDGNQFLRRYLMAR